MQVVARMGGEDFPTFHHVWENEAYHSQLLCSPGTCHMLAVSEGKRKKEGCNSGLLVSTAVTVLACLDQKKWPASMLMC